MVNLRDNVANTTPQLEPHLKSTRKRRRVVDGDEDEGETVTSSSSSLSEAHESPTPEAAGNVKVEEEASQKQRSVLLSIKVSGSSYIKFAVSEEVLNDIPEYSVKLDTAKVSTPEGKRLRITDPKIRREETVLQAIEYLVDGILEPLDACDADKCLAALSELTTLYDFSISMNVATLEAAIISHISEYDFNPITLVYFASDCYRTTRDGSKVAPESSLGQLIKEYLAENLQCIVSGEAYRYISENGGPTLNRQLVEVFSENMLAQGPRQRADGTVKAETVG